MKLKKNKSKYSGIKALKLNSPLFTRILMGLIVLFLLSFFVDIKLILFLILVIVFNAWLANFQIKRGLPTDFELSTFSTVLITLTYGLEWGILVAIVSKLIASLYSGSVLADHLFMIMTYINAALVSFFIGGNVLTIGIIIVMINNVLMFLISKEILGINITANLSYTITNFIFNVLVFSIFAELVYSILG